MGLIKIERSHLILQIANICAWLAIGIFEYFDKVIFGLGFALAFSGLLSICAFAINTDPLWTSYGTKPVFDWLFEEYSNRAINLSTGIIFVVFGTIALVKG